MKFFKAKTKSEKPIKDRAINVQGNPVIIGDRNAIPLEKLKVDKVYRDNMKIVVEGWTTSKNELSLLADNVSLEVEKFQFSRSDVAENLNIPSGDGLGFVLTADCPSEEYITLAWGDTSFPKNTSQPLEFSVQDVVFSGLNGSSSMNPIFDDLKIEAIDNGKDDAIDVQGNPVIIGDRKAIPLGKLKIDKVYRDNMKIVVEGWTTSKNELSLLADNVPLKVKKLQFSRSDVAENLKITSGDKLGFMLTADCPSEEGITLAWGDTSFPKNTSQPLKFGVHDAASSRLNSSSSMSPIFDAPNIGAIAIDHGIALGSKGLLIYGWRHFIKGKVKNLRVHSLEGLVCDNMKSCFNVPRLDVTKSLSTRFMEVSELTGFICHISIPTNVGDARYLEIILDNDTSEWVFIPVSNQDLKGVPLIKDLLTRIPAPDRMRHRLFDLFDQQIGEVIESISAARPAFSDKIEIRQYGVAPENPSISVIVPLYGRYDFVRYQLSHFADDVDFKNVDLIYVIDDPAIIVPTHDLATVYFPVFGIPFRTVSYDSNRGFAGANNIGVSLALGDTVVLMNSDVLPRHNGWLSCLQQSLNNLPEAGAVGPLLQFGDNSVQHAGMVPKKDPRLPGFLLNIHPGKGQPWAGPDTPQEFAMLTAACVMLRKDDYLKLGGLDEGYVIGDFEDSDLCLALRKLGKRLWLVPEVKMWHLERQSQNLESIAGYRQLLTLFNGWRFQKKIREGLINDPTKFNKLEA